MKLCTDPTHKDTPALATHGDLDDRRQCPLCGGERLYFRGKDPGLDDLMDRATTDWAKPRFVPADDGEFPPFRRGSAKTPGSALAAINAIVEQDARARVAREEAEIRAELAACVRSNLATKLEGHRGISTNPGLSEHLLDAAAVIAVDAFAEFYRERSA